MNLNNPVLSKNEAKIDVGLAIRKLRINNGYSQQFVANNLDVSRNAYLDWENNRVNHSIRICSKLCEFYGISLSFFVMNYLEN